MPLYHPVNEHPCFLHALESWTSAGETYPCNSDFYRGNVRGIERGILARLQSDHLSEIGALP